LWRAEYAPRAAGGSPVPVETVWQKILNAPDDSHLHILWHGSRVGSCQVQTRVAEELSKLKDTPGDGIKGHNEIRFTGSLTMEEPRRRVRFSCEIVLSDNEDWEQFRLRVVNRPYVFEVRSVAAEKTVNLHIADGESHFERTFAFSEFRNPLALLNGFIEPFLDQPLNALDLPALTSGSAQHSPAIQWKASTDTLPLGHATVHVYRLQTRLADRYDVAIFVSRAGEILRAELPEGITMLHEKLGN
jgi:hypothetical protein